MHNLFFFSSCLRQQQASDRCLIAIAVLLFGDLYKGTSPKHCIKKDCKLDAKWTCISTAGHSVYTGQAQVGLHNLPHAVCPSIFMPDWDT